MPSLAYSISKRHCRHKRAVSVDNETVARTKARADCDMRLKDMARSGQYSAISTTATEVQCVEMADGWHALCERMIISSTFANGVQPAAVVFTSKQYTWKSH